MKHGAITPCYLDGRWRKGELSNPGNVQSIQSFGTLLALKLD